MTKRPLPLFLTAFALGFVCVERPFAINFPICVIICLLGGFFLLRSYGLFPAPGSQVLFPFSIFFAFATLLPKESLVHYIAYGFTFFCLGLLAIIYLSGKWSQYSLSYYVENFIRLFISIFIGPAKFLYDFFRHRSGNKPVDLIRVVEQAVSYGHYLVIALVVGCSYLLLLSYGNERYQQNLNQFLSSTYGKLKGIIPNLPEIFFIAYVLAGIFLYAGLQSKYKRLFSPMFQFFEKYAISVAILLGALTPLLHFAAFQITDRFKNVESVQFIYVFGIFVLACYNFIMLVWGLHTTTRLKAGWSKRSYTMFNTGIVITNIIILIFVSKYFSLVIIGDRSERILFYLVGFFIWLGLLFLVYVTLEAAQRERHFASVAVWVTLFLGVLLCLNRAGVLFIQYLRSVLSPSFQGNSLDVQPLVVMPWTASPALLSFSYLGRAILDLLKLFVVIIKN